MSKPKCGFDDCVVCGSWPGWQVVAKPQPKPDKPKPTAQGVLFR